MSIIRDVRLLEADENRRCRADGHRLGWGEHRLVFVVEVLPTPPDACRLPLVQRVPGGDLHARGAEAVGVDEHAEFVTGGVETVPSDNQVVEAMLVGPKRLGGMPYRGGRATLCLLALVTPSHD